jgi:hypothetical protein
MRAIKIIGSLAVIGLGASLLWNPRSERPAAASGEGAESAELRALRSQVAKLERRTQILQTRLADAEQGVLAPGSVAVEPAQPAREANDSAEHDPELRRAALQERDRKLTETAKRVMEEAHGRMASDATWSTQARQSLDQLLADPVLAGSRAAGADCKETLCRITLEHDGPESWSRFRPKLATAPFDNDVFFNHDPDTGKTVVYVARHGHKLPPVTIDNEAQAAR